MKLTKEQLAAIDFTLPNRVIAKQLGTTPRTIGYYRKLAGGTKATKYAPQDSSANKRMSLSVDQIDWSKSRREIAKECGVSPQRISQLWKRMNESNA